MNVRNTKIKNMKVKHPIFWITIVAFLTLSAFLFLFLVKEGKPKNNISVAELRESKNELALSILRYEQDLFSLDVNNLRDEVERLSKIYPNMVVAPGIWEDPEQLDGLKRFLQDTIIISLQEEVKKVVKTDAILRDLETGFGYYKVFYPNEVIPKIITQILGIDLGTPSVYLYDDILFINVDMYLGASYPYYSAAGIPVYISDRYELIYLPVDVFKRAIVFRHLARVPGTTLLDAMITEGKKMFFTEMMLPALHERLIIGYSEEKYDWACKFMGNAWSYVIEKNELFGKGETLFRVYVEEAPFTRPFGHESPGRMGAFLGWKLVQSYMKNNPKVTLQELMQETDYQKILHDSKFKPQVR